MNLRFFALFAATCAFALSARADYDFKEPFTKEAAFHADGVLSVENVNGDISVVGWDKNEIQIDGEKSGATEEDLKQIELTMAISDAHAHIKVRYPKRSGSWGHGKSIRAAVRLTIKLPATASVDRIDVVNSGIQVRGIRGLVKAESVNGGIKVSDLSGGAELETVNGSIHAEFASIQSHQNLKLETVNGSITARLPANTGASVRAETVNGGISTDFPLTISGKFIGRHLNGTIGDGRASIRAQTVNGAIALDRI